MVRLRIFYALCLVLNWWFYLRKGSEIKTRNETQVRRAHLPPGAHGAPTGETMSHFSTA